MCKCGSPVAYGLCLMGSVACNKIRAQQHKPSFPSNLELWPPQTPHDNVHQSGVRHFKGLHKGQAHCTSPPSQATMSSGLNKRPMTICTSLGQGT